MVLSIFAVIGAADVLFSALRPANPESVVRRTRWKDRGAEERLLLVLAFAAFLTVAVVWLRRVVHASNLFLNINMKR